MPNQAVFDMLLCNIISEFLGGFHTLKGWDRVCKMSHGHVKNADVIRYLVMIPEKKRFNEACKHGCIELIDMHIPKSGLNVGVGFYDACSYARADAAMHILNKYGVSAEMLKYSLIQSCVSGHLEMAKLLVPKQKNDAWKKDEFLFVRVCRNGHTEIAKWLHGIIQCSSGFMDIHATDAAISAQRLDTIKWLLVTYNFDVAYNNHSMLYRAVSNNNQEFLEWVLSEYSKSQEYINSAFRMTCKSGNRLMADVLLKHFDIGHVIMDQAFRLSLGCKSVEFIEWLLMECCYCIDIDDCFLEACRNRYRISAKYLYSKGARTDIMELYKHALLNNDLLMTDFLKELDKDLRSLIDMIPVHYTNAMADSDKASTIASANGEPT